MLSRKITVEMTPPSDQDMTDASARLLAALPRELGPVQLDPGRRFGSCRNLAGWANGR